MICTTVPSPYIILVPPLLFKIFLHRKKGVGWVQNLRYNDDGRVWINIMKRWHVLKHELMHTQLDGLLIFGVCCVKECEFKAMFLPCDMWLL